MGNVAKWILNTPEKRISNIFKSIMQDYVFNDEEIKIAIQRLSKRTALYQKSKIWIYCEKKLLRLILRRKSLSLPTIQWSHQRLTSVSNYSQIIVILPLGLRATKRSKYKALSLDDYYWRL